jgi:aminoglycoside/choline kinase family phosphotransferase
MTQNDKDVRLELVKAWLKGLAPKYGLQLETLAPASADASFRRYFRLAARDGVTMIVMDAPPPRENIAPFMKVDALMHQAGLNVPQLYETDEGQGLILMSDLGRQTYLDVLTEDNAFGLFDAATDALVEWQRISKPGILPEYDHAVLKREIDLFPEWYVARHRGYRMNDKQREIVGECFEKIIAHNLAENRVFVHRDFMPRNLMVSNPNPGVIDFQDALYGPVSYDIASLMRDAFVSWGESFVLDTTIRYWEKARKAGIAVPEDFGVFWEDVEWMGMQRHLKVLGIFARINYRDGKPKYLADTPRFLNYVRQTSNRYHDLKPINWLLDEFEEEKSRHAWTF